MEIFTADKALELTKNYMLAQDRFIALLQNIKAIASYGESVITIDTGNLSRAAVASVLRNLGYICDTIGVYDNKLMVRW